MSALRQIGDVAEQIGLSLRTIRHYEEVGLVVPSARSQGGFRLYAEADVERLRLIMRMKPLGFTLEEMRELIEALEGEPDLDRLRAFHEAALVKVTALREQLDVAEGFAAVLAERVARHR